MDFLLSILRPNPICWNDAHVLGDRKRTDESAFNKDGGHISVSLCVFVTFLQPEYNSL